MMACILVAFLLFPATLALRLVDPTSPEKGLEMSQVNSTSRVKIVCTGWKKSGTSSMGHVYNMFGITPTGSCNACKEPTCMDHYRGVEDAYVCCNSKLIEAMKAKYADKDVKFVHVERRTDRWLASVDAWLKKPSKKSTSVVYSHLMGADHGTKQFAENYEKHNARIREIFKHEPHRLLVLNLEDNDPVQNMEKFCEFIGVDPKKDARCMNKFPHANAHHHNFTASAAASNFDEKSPSMDSEDPWLMVDEVEDELDGFDWELSMRDWTKYN